jgi:formylglycine-generating enzyme required for sulfatase activity
VVTVSWANANAFCEWLSRKEGKRYRLPTDREWSIAVGLGKEDQPTIGLSPEELSKLDIPHFPWNGAFPPRTADRVGNYADTVWHEAFPEKEYWISDYLDGHATTAPVMSFKPNALGLFDMGGNVTEWCLDLYTTGREDRVTRGGSYHVSSQKMMRSGYRGYGPDGLPSNGSGFRVVLEQEQEKGQP